MIDDLCDGPSEEDIAIAMFYCDFRDQHEQTTTNIIGAILKQLVVRGQVLEQVQKAFQKAKKEVGGRGLRLPDMVQMLKQAVTTLPQVFICIDALDECLPKHLLELLVSLKDILYESPTARIFLTGRPQAEAEIRRYFPNGVIIPISPKKHDIKSYLEKKLEMDTEHYAMSDSLRADILRTILGLISETCVWAYMSSLHDELSYFTNHGLQIPPCFTEHRRDPGRGYHLCEKTKVERDDQGQSFGRCVHDNPRSNEGTERK